MRGKNKRLCIKIIYTAMLILLDLLIIRVFYGLFNLTLEAHKKDWVAAIKSDWLFVGVCLLIINGTFLGLYWIWKDYLRSNHN
jgi:succinate dehydrogenase hydrophobic anchor subunit